MKLKTLTIQNFRCFESLEMDLNEQLTVIVAKNGQGKSSILDAVRIGLWSFVSGFDLEKNKEISGKNNINVNDVRIIKIREGEMAHQLPCRITLEAEFNPENFIKYQDKVIDNLQWTRSRLSQVSSNKTIDNKSSTLVKKVAIATQNDIRNPEIKNINLPIIFYYGINRNLTKNYDIKKEKSRKKSIRISEDMDFFLKQEAVIRNNSVSQTMSYILEHYFIKENFFNRVSVYNDCLNSASSYESFKDWFIWIFECYREEQIKNTEKGISPDTNSEWKNTISVIQQAINAVLEPETGWHNLEYSVSDEKSLILNHNELGKLKIEQLSDGIRGILAMVGDIAYRCIKLNPHLGMDAAKETSGIVMIDEIEMHLHPAWQQSILINLCKAFENIQFIVTTHSPQVISTVASEQIRILDNGQVYSAEAGTQGAESSRILKQVFGVELRPKNLDIVNKLNEYLELVDKDEWDSLRALELHKDLDEWSQGNEPELFKADVDIRMKDYQRGL